MQVRVAKADPHFFDKFTDRATLIFVELSELLKQFRIDLTPIL
jgi:hypothetical protein